MKPQDELPTEPTEILAQRTDTAKHIQLPDGQIEAQVHAVPIHYKDSSGAFQDVKTDLVADTSPSEITQKVEEHELKVSLIDTFDQPTLYQRDGYPDLSLTPIGGNSVKGETIKNSTFYIDAYFGVDVEQRVTLTGVKEYITLKDASHPRKLEYAYDTTLIPQIVDNQVLFMQDGELVYRLTPLFEMKNDRFGNPEFQWIIDEKQKTLYIDLPEFSTYPVVIDPTVSPYAGSGDGWVRKSNSSSWATTVAQGATGSSADYTGTSVTCQVYGDPSTILYCDRIFMVFDTSSVGSGSTVTAATLNLKGTVKGNVTIVGDYNVYESTITSDTTIVTSDFGSYNTTALATAIAHGSISASAYNTWTLNSTGRGLVNVTGYSKYCIRHSYDYNGTTPGVTGNYAYFSASSSEASGTSNDPYLSVTYTAGATFIAKPNQVINQTIKKASTI